MTIPAPLDHYKARWIVTKLLGVLRAHIENKLQEMSIGELLAQNFEVSLFVRTQVKTNSDPNHSPSYYMGRVQGHPLYKMIEKELLRRDTLLYNDWDPGPGLNLAQIQYKLQQKSRKHVQD